MKETEFVKIEVDQVSVVEIFENYFSGAPPFGEGKKKDEFPDAFALLALQQEAKDRKKVIYVVSGDRDWENFCSLRSENLTCIKKLDKLLETISQETDSKEEVDLCYKLYKEKEYQIKRGIEDKFLALYFSIDLSGTSLEIESGSEEIKIFVNSVDITDYSLLYINNSNVEQPSVVFKLDADVNYDANVSYEILEFAIITDNKYYVDETTTRNKVFTHSIDFNVEVTLTLYRDENDFLHNADIKKINIDPNNILSEVIVDKILENYY